MSEIQKAFDAGNYHLVRVLAKDSALLNQIQTDPKVIWAGLFGLFSLIFAALLTLI